MAASTQRAWCPICWRICGFSEVGSSVGFVGFLWLVRLCWLVLLVLLVGFAGFVGWFFLFVGWLLLFLFTIRFFSPLELSVIRSFLISNFESHPVFSNIVEITPFPWATDSAVLYRTSLDRFLQGSGRQGFPLVTAMSTSR